MCLLRLKSLLLLYFINFFHFRQKSIYRVLKIYIYIYIETGKLIFLCYKMSREFSIRTTERHCAFSLAHVHAHFYPPYSLDVIGSSRRYPCVGKRILRVCARSLSLFLLRVPRSKTFPSPARVFDSPLREYASGLLEQRFN